MSDESKYFVCADRRVFENIHYLTINGKYAVLSTTAQKVMKNKNEYLQFNTNKDNVAADEIGIRYLLTALSEEKIKEYKKKLVEGHERSNLTEAVRELKEILRHFAEFENSEKTGKGNQRPQNKQQELLNTNPSTPNISTHLLEENNKTGKQDKNESSNLYPHSQLTELSNITQPFHF